MRREPAAHGPPAPRRSVRLPCPDPEVLGLDVPLAEPEARRPWAVLVEERRLEPFSLLRRVDRREEILPGWKPAKLELPVLIGPRRHDLPGLRPPHRRVGGE